MDLTDRMVGITITDTDLKSLVDVTSESTRRAGIWQAFGKVIGHAPVGFFLEVHWLGKPMPRAGQMYVDNPDRRPARLAQWRWVITMTLHRPSDPTQAPSPTTADEDWRRRQIEDLGSAEGAPEP